MRRLIINADDFGLTAGVNRAIVEAHEARGRYFSYIDGQRPGLCGRDRSGAIPPRLGVGCHIVLVDGAPLLDQTAVRSSGGSRGNRAGVPHFREGIARFGALALLGRLSENEIEAEATAQIRKLQAAGIPVTHLDSHKHTHLFPRVLRPLLRAAASCGVKAIRNPFERIQGSQLAASPSLWRRWIEVGVLRGLAGSFVKPCGKQE